MLPKAASDSVLSNGHFTQVLQLNLDREEKLEAEEPRVKLMSLLDIDLNWSYIWCLLTEKGQTMT